MWWSILWGGRGTGLSGSYHFLLQSQQFCPQCLVTVKEKIVQADKEWKDTTTVNITQEIMYYRTHISRLSQPLILDATHR